VSRIAFPIQTCALGGMNGSGSGLDVVDTNHQTPAVSLYGQRYRVVLLVRLKVASDTEMAARQLMPSSFKCIQATRGQRRTRSLVICLEGKQWPSCARFQFALILIVAVALHTTCLHATAAVDFQSDTCDKPSFITRQIQASIGDILWGARSSKRNSRNEPFPVLVGVLLAKEFGAPAKGY